MNAYKDIFFEKYRCQPDFAISAPGRINLIGEHIDYLDGLVMPAAIEPHITMLATSDPESNQIEVFCSGECKMEGVIDLNDLGVRESERWLNYLIGVLAGYREREIDCTGARIGIFSTLPLGAGLSSSAALETATALLIEALTGQELSVLDRALICQKAEHKYVGVPCGIMDQLSIGAAEEGAVLKIDCLDHSVELLPLPEELCLVVADSGVKHSLGDGEYRIRRSQCEEALFLLGEDSWRDVAMEQVKDSEALLGDVLFRRARHAVTEMTRVQQFAHALETGQIEEIGEIMKAGHKSLKDDFEVSCPELDALVDAGYEFGVDCGQIGSRMTGGGFGGSTIHLVRENVANEFIEFLKERYRDLYSRDLHCFQTRASAGAKFVHFTAHE